LFNRRSRDVKNGNTRPASQASLMVNQKEMCQNSDVQQKNKVRDSMAEWSQAIYLGNQEHFNADMKIGSGRGVKG
jgi:CRISPR/Cas system type I-B associated protein Csh2 (Cas7 group RAMP superfamily)